MTVFLAGGAVRDLSTGFPVRDLDFSVQGNALKLKKALEKAGGKLWGEHEPTRTLFFWFPGSVRIEISSTRREDYPKLGKPVYHWATIVEDLRRRDFTANAMAISLNEGSYGLLLDPMNGIADIEARHLRLVSNYGFLEDPSRMIRATRLAARTGWEMEERTKVRYENAKAEDGIDSLSPYLKGYELEEIGHEEDALKILRALEAEGWIKHLFPAWTSAKADLAGLENLHRILIQLLMQGVNPDPSAAQMQLLTAKLPPKDLSALKKMFPCQGFVEQWDQLDEDAKEFAKVLTGREAHTPSATWKLVTSYQPEPVLWLAYSSKSAPVQAKFKNFFTVWPEARQNVPVALMQEMRITPELPDYAKLLQEMFYQLIDGKLQTPEEMRAFLEPWSPPAPPPPVTFRRTRGRRSETKRMDEDEDENEMPDAGSLEGDEDLDHDEADEDESEDKEIIPPMPPARIATKAVKKAAPEAPSAAEKSAAKPAPEAGNKAKHPVPPAKPEKAAGKAPEKPAAKKPEPKPAPAKSAKAPVKSAAKTVAKPAAKKPAHKPVPAKKAAKPVHAHTHAQKAAKPAHKPAKSAAAAKKKKH
ncbi:CCA tRNA nucleotidyltransferase [Paracidobacterium acidisoli]|nr:CCA tRNA nucleotidyltransferase [Paracidobacterium acidisoli]